MSDQNQNEQPQFPEESVDKLIKDFGKKPTKEEVDAVEKMARELRPQYEKIEQARNLSQKPKQQRKLGRRM